MLRQLYILTFLLVILSCKSDDSQPQADFESIAGTWRLTEVEKGTFGNKYWEPANSKSVDNLIFRTDGAVLDLDSLQLCCGPTSLQINGEFYEIRPTISVTYNPLCAVINCVFCPTWEMEWKGNELIITDCLGFRRKFLRY